MRIGTRGSALALAQARLVAQWLGGAEIVVVRTRGDTMHEPPSGGRELPGPNGTGNGGHGRGLSNGHGASKDQGGRARHEERSRQEKEEKGSRPERSSREDKSRWVAELEQALLAEEIDLAVHSAKDIPAELHDGLELLGSPSRAAAEDALIGAHSLEQLPEGACVGTSSVRRAAQLRAARGDLEVVSLRGNVDTRLRKLAGAVTASGDGSGGSDSSLHAIVLAKAGLQRLGRERDIGCTLDAAHFVPAPGQGALGLQARRGDSTVSEAVAPILDKDASACLLAERALAHALGASCNTPLGAHAAAAGCGCLHMHAWIGLLDGSEWIADELLGGFYDPAELGIRMAERLQTVGARELLARAEELAVERD
ncbi:MAG TPA: hydroxymethylbilane synthase [Solirubrobacteraceae bacterium]|jgi:hydroxymethylbilane synthase|nr:hydroxymethylbilane synthase [Solirubrobacteraceae bacterium]